MRRPNTLNGATIALDECGRLGDAFRRLANRDDASVLGPVAFAPSASSFGLSQGDALMLALPTGDPQEHGLNRFENNAGDALGVYGKIGQVHDARNSNSGTSCADCRNQLLGLCKKQAADTVDLLGVPTAIRNPHRKFYQIPFISLIVRTTRRRDTINIVGQKNSLATAFHGSIGQLRMRQVGNQASYSPTRYCFPTYRANAVDAFPSVRMTNIWKRDQP